MEANDVLDRLDALLAEATAGPWFVFKMDGYPQWVSAMVPHNGEMLRSEIPAGDVDDDLICALRNAAPALIRMARAAIEMGIRGEWLDELVLDAIKALGEVKL